MQAHFIGAKVITSKKDGKDYGIVSVAVKAKEGGQAQDLFCEPDVAKRASQTFAFLQAVELVVEQSLGYRGLELRLSDVHAVK